MFAVPPDFPGCSYRANQCRRQITSSCDPANSASPGSPSDSTMWCNCITPSPTSSSDPPGAIDEAVDCECAFDENPKALGVEDLACVDGEIVVAHIAGQVSVDGDNDVAVGAVSVEARLPRSGHLELARGVHEHRYPLGGGRIVAVEQFSGTHV